MTLTKGIALALGFVLLSLTPAAAGPDLSTDVVAPYVHVPLPVPPALGPMSTVFFIRSPKAAPVQVRVQCFNHLAQFVGPTPQPRFVDLNMFQTFAVTPDLPHNLAASPLFTGLGWCYFSSSDKFSVDVAWAVLPGPPGTLTFNGLADFTNFRLFSSNNSVGVAVGVGQAMVVGGLHTTGPPTPGVGDVPVWTGGNWIDYLVLVNPTASSGTATVNVINCAGCSPASAPTPVVVPLPARGMGVVLLSAFSGAFPNGNATISSGTTCCFTGWHWAINLTTHQAVFREIALDRDTARLLNATDRP